MRSLLSMPDVRKILDRKRKRLKEHFSDEDELSRHGMEHRGYLIGQISLLEDLLEDLKGEN